MSDFAVGSPSGEVTMVTWVAEEDLRRRGGTVPRSSVSASTTRTKGLNTFCGTLTMFFNRFIVLISRYKISVLRPCNPPSATL